MSSRLVEEARKMTSFWTNLQEISAWLGLSAAVILSGTLTLIAADWSRKKKALMGAVIALAVLVPAAYAAVKTLGASSAVDLAWDGGVYAGETYFGVPNGKGVFIWPNGDKYTGDWTGGERTGQGVYIWPSGDQYTGGWLQGKQSGQGVYTWPDGRRYAGEWREGKRSGPFVYTDPNGLTYNQVWKDNELVSSEQAP
jgi:hypothetical protein